MSAPSPHQYIDRDTGAIVTERLIADAAVSFLYNRLRESAPAMFTALTSARMSGLLGFLGYDLPPGRGRIEATLRRLGIDRRECLAPAFTSLRAIFERQIRYWETRPMPADPAVVVSPADARLLIGSFATTSALCIKEKLFSLAELLGGDRRWPATFADGDFAVCRLTPDKYHYNHLPVSGRIADIYQVDGRYHSCNPLAAVAVASLYAKNRRIVTIIDTDVPGGSQIGPVAMVEIVALMIGDIRQAYSERRYDDPAPVTPGLFVRRGCPKSLFRPGSSTDVLIFAPGKIRFAPDLLENTRRTDVCSRFTTDGGAPIVETDVRVRSPLAERRSP